VQDDWLEYLSGQGAAVEGNSVLSFGGASVGEESATGNWAAPLTDFVVVEASGADAAEFLQAQFCNDVAKLADQPPGADQLAQLNGYCNPKGRLLSLFYLMPGVAGQGFRLVLPAPLADGFTKRLSMFVLRADVQFQVLPQVHVLALGGSQATSFIDSLLGGAKPAADVPDFGVLGEGEVQAVCLPGGRWLLLADPAMLQNQWHSMVEQITPVGANRWWLASVEQGEALIVEQTTEKFVPQMVNLEAIDGLSFKKGCYPGQEIVARMQYLGKLKRRMRRLRLPAAADPHNNTAPQPGAALHHDEDKDAGTLVTVAVNAEGGFDALAVLKVGYEASALSVEDFAFADGQTVQELDLPYTLAAADCG